uniref:Uncharacterized protein n=1 Tax=Cucumis melo TaxID=3656 RepID=A0A9I9ECS2_CUCME
MPNNKSAWPIAQTTCAWVCTTDFHSPLAISSCSHQRASMEEPHIHSQPHQHKSTCAHNHMPCIWTLPYGPALHSVLIAMLPITPMLLNNHLGARPPAAY